MATELDDDMLQRFHDGDLSSVEAAAVRTQLQIDPGARERLVQLQRLSRALQVAADEMCAELDSSALYMGIEKALQQAKPAALGERLLVTAGEWRVHRRGTWLAAGGTLAVAAAVMLAMLARTTDHPIEARNKPRPREERKERLAETTPVETPPMHGSEVENVDFGLNTGTVFQVDHDGIKTAVVWIADEEENAP